MLFWKNEEPERVEHRRPCEVDGSKAWYHGLIHCDRTVALRGGCIFSGRSIELDRYFNSKTKAFEVSQMFVERQTFAMVEYLDGSVAKVDPEKVRFTDV